MFLFRTKHGLKVAQFDTKFFQSLKTLTLFLRKSGSVTGADFRKVDFCARF